MLTAFVHETLPKAEFDPLKHIILQAKPLQDLSELVSNDLFPNIGLFAILPVARAMIVNVAPFLDLAHHRAAAMATLHQARERKIARPAAQLLRIADFKEFLNLLPKLLGDEGLMFSLIALAPPFILAGVDAIAKNGVNVAGRHRTTGNARD